jgi:hypothetical protein
MSYACNQWPVSRWKPIWSRIEPAAFCEDLIDACVMERTSKEPMAETGSGDDIRI